MNTLVGTCGFAESHGDTFRDFGIVEVQQTFYQPPRIAMVERWRTEAPGHFVFTFKAWQLLTHEATSPAYHYHYRYHDEELSGLCDMLSHGLPNWVLFNNDCMADDAKRFIRLLRRAS